MWFKRMSLEEWFDKYQYEVEYDIGESAVKFHTFDDLGFDLGALPIRYGYHLGRPDLRELLAEDFPGMTGDDVIVTSGASEANFAIIAALMCPGDHVVVEHPNYTSMYEVPRSLGCDVSFFELSFDDDFKPDLDRLESLITPKTKLISLTHPNNPTGSMVTLDELEDIIRIVEKHDVYLLFDETYREFAFDGILPSAATLSPKVISISSMSKCYGLPGIRIGWVASQDKKLMHDILAIREQVSITNNAISEEIATRVLKDKDGFLAKAKAHIASNRDSVGEWIKTQQYIEWVFPEAGVVGFPRLTEDVGIDPEKLYVRLAETYKTFTIPGRCFEMDNRYFRLGFGANHDEMMTGLDNLETAINDLRS